jgi:anti-sigma regulatory factor (Ser/Thr protein kinase)
MSLSLNVEEGGSRTIRIAVNPAADFRDVIHVFDAIEIPATAIGADNLKFAILELVNNSIRAHHERGEARDISVDLTVTGRRLHISVRDFGGGFDPGILPYGLDDDPQSLDLHTEGFQQYRRRNNYTRFGMGIYLAKKSFEHFHLLFLDETGVPVQWGGAARISGTLIRVDLETREASDG